MEYGKLIINKFIKDSSKENMNALIRLAVDEKLNNSNIVHLASELANSGQLIPTPKGLITADIPSTGGPSSLSTLICPLILVELGFLVPKLGVKGRPAGGIDVLYQVPGYNINPNHEEIKQSLSIAKYCHLIVNDNYAPLDAKLFKYRSEIGAKAVPALVIASILSKKITAGLNYTGLDVRVASFGNFGTTMEKAKENSKRFIAVAKIAGIKATCFLNDFSIIQQPYIGRGESLLALHSIFENNMDDLLRQHVHNCIGMSTSLALNYKKDISISYKKIAHNFELNLKTQGADMKNFITKVREIQKEHCNIVKAQYYGFLVINLEKVRDLIVKFQNMDKSNSLFPDTCGIIFKKTSNEYIAKGDIICTYRITDSLFDDFKRELMSVFTIEDIPRSTEQNKFLKYA